MTEICTLVGTVHFITENQNEPYIWYGEVSIAGKKCAGYQEHPKKDGLVPALEGCGV